MDLKLVDTTSNATFTSAGTGAGIVDSGTPRLAGDAAFLTKLNGGANITLDQAASSFGTPRRARQHGGRGGRCRGDRHPGGGGADLEAGGHHQQRHLHLGGHGAGIVDSGTLTIGGDAAFLTKLNGGANITLDQAAFQLRHATARTPTRRARRPMPG